MTRYLVWDPMASSATQGEEHEASSPGEAAELYASEDVDGGIQGLYVGGCDLQVRDLDSGHQSTVRVTVEYAPTFSSKLLLLEGG